MVRYFTLGHRLPGFLTRPLFGDRARFGLEVRPDDPCWREWERTQDEIYQKVQKQSVGDPVNQAGYSIMRHIPLAGKRVLEIGPGMIGHVPYWQDRPEHVTLVDCRPAWLEEGTRKLRSLGVPHETCLVDRERPHALPFADGTFDVVISFYVLEHLYPLASALDEQARVLRPGGVFAGAIPAEGGLAWGLGRAVTSRRWFLKNTTMNPDKLICWAHPNFASDILGELERRFRRERVSYWPLRVPSIDMNLIVRFLFRKAAQELRRSLPDAA